MHLLNLNHVRMFLSALACSFTFTCLANTSTDLNRCPTQFSAQGIKINLQVADLLEPILARSLTLSEQNFVHELGRSPLPYSKKVRILKSKFTKAEAATIQNSEMLSSEDPFVLKAMHPGDAQISRDATSGAEVESKISGSRLLEMTDSENGYVELILRGYPAPNWLLDEAAKQNTSIWHLRFNQLSLEDRADLLDYASSKRMQATTAVLPQDDVARVQAIQLFEQNRRIPGLKFTDQMLIEANKNFPNIALQKTIEYMGSDSILSFSRGGFEFHLRSKPNFSSAGEIAGNAFKWAELHQLDSPDIHTHLVAKMPPRASSLGLSPSVETFKVVDFLQRVETIFQILSVLRGYSLAISEGATGQIIKFSDSENKTRLRTTRHWLDADSEDFHKMYDRLFLWHSGQAEYGDLVGDGYSGFTSFKGKDTYAGQNLWGIEARDVSRSHAPQNVSNLLNAIHARLVTHSYGISDQNIQRWWQLNRPTNGSFSDGRYVGIMYYWNRSHIVHTGDDAVGDKLEEHPEIFEKLEFYAELKNKSVFDGFLRSETKRAEVYLLTHDWSSTPVFFSNPVARRKISIAQLRAFDNILHSTIQISAILRNFLATSGLVETLLESVGVEYFPIEFSNEMQITDKKGSETSF